MEAILVTPEHLAKWVTRPTASDHKYSRGVAEFHTGSRAYPGAALLGVLAALRTGVGMVRYLGPPSVGSLVIQNHPEVVLVPGRVDSVVVGSGMAAPLGARATARVREAFSQSVPTVIDAGALDLAEEAPAHAVLTPHARELERLHHRVLGVEVTDELDAATRLAKELGVTILMKGSVTRVVNQQGSLWELPPATPWLATAGTGDVLAGILGALLAGRRDHLASTPGDLGEIAGAGALLHALAAQSASTARAGGPITAIDVADHVASVVGVILEARS